MVKNLIIILLLYELLKDPLMKIFGGKNEKE